jgi:2-polyprenyl-3-methyl-5-hydroxy-6-metoxy-1,4-benzoquinol methylase
MMKNEKCIVCGNSEYNDFKMNLLRCKGCDVVINPVVWEFLANENLEQEWFDVEIETNVSPWIKIFERWNNLRTKRRIMEFSLAGKRMLEIGVGTGSFSNMMRTSGYAVQGCDLSGSTCELVKKRFNIPMHHGHVWTMPAGQLFDVVVMNHVLEHVADPLRLLREVRQRIKPGGILHVAVPNINSWSAQFPGWTSYEPYHLTYFTPQNLRYALEFCGYKIEFLATHESFSGWYLAVLRTVLRTYELNAETRGERKASYGCSIPEHAYRLGMVVAGILSFPFRLMQSRLGRGDETVILARGCR